MYARINRWPFWSLGGSWLSSLNERRTIPAYFSGTSAGGGGMAPAGAGCGAGTGAAGCGALTACGTGCTGCAGGGGVEERLATARGGDDFGVAGPDFGLIKGEQILDSFGGTCGTIPAGHTYQCEVTAIEQSQEYYAIGLKRLSDLKSEEQLGLNLN